MSETTSAAVLGTGTMGAAMARNLLAAGLHVRVWNRTPAKAEALAGEGAVFCSEPADAVRGADTVLTSLFDSASVLRTMHEALDGLSEGTAWLQASTVGPEGTAPLAAFAREHGLEFLDSPVLGTKAPAEAGRLTVLASGSTAARDKAGPVLDAIGSRTVWLDTEPGSASRLKLVLNNWVLTLINGTAETLALAEGLGVDPSAFLDAVQGGPLDSPYLRTKAAHIINGDYTASFPLSGARKDATLIAQEAERAGVRLDLAPAGAERLRRAEELGHGAEDAAASFLAGFEERRRS
ncbi:NAD(P)-dependent oxidoreductase [Streptomyces sulphureus]|uniref:NAD(P)-dependent oxidoreductase n=1 Tax=Streptomyces sulphureus TaxID=47758 RepID=UPI0009960464|nr:NAD(P)-dependent oxidoreductase [Streptomyces sulphureus]